MTMIMNQHDSYVKEIATQMKENFKQQKKVRIYHSTTNSMDLLVLMEV